MCAIGLSVVFSLAGWAPLIPTEFHVVRGTQVPADRITPVSRTGLSPAMVMLSNMFCYKCHSTPSPVLQPRVRPCDLHGLGSCAFARHYLRNHYYFLFLRVLRCFSSPRSPHLLNECGDGIAPAGFPHSDICGSQGICPSPQLFAAYRVLRRLREPQASPVRPYLLSLFSFAFLNLIHRCFFSLSLMSRCGTIMFCTTPKK